MRLVRVDVAGFKGVDAGIEFAPAMVLFGPNDAGKTNLLEALELMLASDSPKLLRRDPVRRMQVPDAGEDTDLEIGSSVVLELDGLDVEGHPDQTILLIGASATANNSST